MVRNWGPNQQPCEGAILEADSLAQAKPSDETAAPDTMLTAMSWNTLNQNHLVKLFMK